jgi:excisionase family DNA binding protein
MKITTNHCSPELPRLFFTRLEAAQVAGISLSTLDRETKANRIPCKRVRGRVLYPKSDFMTWCSAGGDWMDGAGAAA